MANKQYEAKVVLSSMYGMSLGKPKRANRHFTAEELKGFRVVLDKWTSERWPKDTGIKKEENHDK